MRKHLMFLAVLGLLAFTTPASAHGNHGGILPGGILPGGINPGGIQPGGGNGGNGGGQIPEPASLALLAGGVAVYAMIRRRRKRSDGE